MNGMFSDCYNIRNLDLNNFNTENVVNMSYMFENCYNLISLDLSSFDTRNVNNIEDLFSNCINLGLLFINLDSYEKLSLNLKNINYIIK